MKNKTTLMGAALGLVGAVLLILFVAQAGGAAGDEATTPAYVVTENLEPGMSAEEISGRVEATQVPERTAPQQRITDLDDLAGKEIVRTVGVGEVLTATQLAEPGPLSGGVVVPAGYEAVTVEADPAPGVESYVTPGSRVNVYATVSGGGGAPAEGQPAASGPFTQLVLGHVDVLATSRGDSAGGSQEGGSDGRIVLMLQVRPEDAPVLIHAERQADLWFSLVNPDDPAPTSERVDLGQFEPGARTSAINEARSQQDSDDQTQEDQQ